MHSLNQTCTTCTGSTEFKEGRLCFECVANCEVCAANQICLICKSGYLLKSSDSCVLIRNIAPVLYFGTSLTVVFLDFFSPTQTFVDRISAESRLYIKVNISGLEPEEYTFSVGKSSSSALQLSFNYRRSIEKGMQMQVNIVPSSWMTSEIEEKLILFNFSINFPDPVISCKSGFFMNQSKKKSFFK